MSSRRTTSEPTVGRHVMRMLVSTEKHGDMIISGRRPIASESPPKIGETMKPSTPAIDSRLPCARACAASVRSSFSEAQEKTKRAAALTIAGVVVEPDLRLGLHAHHDAEGCAAAALDFFERRRKGSCTYCGTSCTASAPSPPPRSPSSRPAPSRLSPPAPRPAPPPRPRGRRCGAGWWACRPARSPWRCAAVVGCVFADRSANTRRCRDQSDRATQRRPRPVSPRAAERKTDAARACCV